MSHLLKQKSKVGVYQKERVTYEPFDFASKRKRDTSDQKKPGSQQPGDNHVVNWGAKTYTAKQKDLTKPDTNMDKK